MSADAERLIEQRLPIIESRRALAQAMGISPEALHALTATRGEDRRRYRRFSILKRGGDTRVISTPTPELSRAQRWVLEQILLQVAPGEQASDLEHAHQETSITIIVELMARRAHITARRVRGLFIALGYSATVADALERLCTEVSEGRRGAPTRHLPPEGPLGDLIADLVCRRLDRRLTGLARSLGCAYTRQGDTLTFSTHERSSLGVFLKGVSDIVHDEGFALYPERTRIIKEGQLQPTAGLTFEDLVSVDRRALKRFRATLHQIERDGPQGKRWGDGEDLLASIRGYADFIALVRPARGAKFQEQVSRIEALYGAEMGACVEHAEKEE